MIESVFIEWLKRYLPNVTVSIVNKLNDSKNPLPYLYRTMLRKTFSVSGKWSSIYTSSSLVMADMVATNSALPLKKRDSRGQASGDISKMGMKLFLNEQQLQDLDTLVATGGTDAQIAAALFQDMPKAIGGIYERIEFMFLRGLSTGVCLVEDTETVGTGIRVDYGYQTENKFGVVALWSNPSTARPFDDIERVLEKARTLDGNPISRLMMDPATFKRLASTDQSKELFAFSQDFVGTKVPTPSLSQVNTFTSDRYNFTISTVDRSVRSERDGTRTPIKPWQDGMVVFLESDQVGDLVYAKLAEQTRPVAGVQYQLVDDFILTSMYRKNDPVSEYTTSQARVVPIVSNADRIYTLDTKAIQV